MSFAQKYMPRPVVSLFHASKDYSLDSSFLGKIKGLFFNNNSKTKTYRAVNDINFVLRQGEVVGLIGLDGSGKSTIGAMIAGATEPTEGRVRVKGEVSMLTVDSCMNPELTGKDNILLRLALAGLSGDEAEEVEKQITDFADLGLCIDKPVKTYPSGMTSRLEFALSVYTNPDILIIDEALSASDSFFDKYVEKIKELKNNGKTIVYISRETTRAQAFCDRIIWINKGRVIGDGEPDKIIAPYCGFKKEYESMTDDERAYAQPELESYQKKYLR